ncbi:IS3 family transposase [Saccharothrix violaceirubra]|uniref:IS3 family transposase n=1 Tax=Saccharothrix violaceirubra TaxID=413306 RepID=UPI001FEA63AF|nr:IS3 family transposase [Saccharothrix violaceirubra]
MTVSSPSDKQSRPSRDDQADPAPRPSRRVFTPDYKLAVVTEYENAPAGEKGAILRREGLYSSHIIEWTRARDAGRLTGQAAEPGAQTKPARKSAEQVELERLRRQNEKLASDLAKTRMALDIMGKAHALLEELFRERGGRHAASQILTTAFTELRAAGLSVKKSCALTGTSRATHYRHLNPTGPIHGPRPARTPPPQALDADERARVLEVLTSPAYRDLAIPQVWARELDEGRYWCSISTMYRIARAQGQVRERRRIATHPPRTRPELSARGPGEVWSWDITALKGPVKGVWYKCYVVLDIFSRYVTGWLVAAAEDAVLAKDFLAEAIARNGTEPHTIHADRGGAMVSKPVSELLTDLGVLRSHSRPRTSNDNPYSEAQFKTLKYMPDFPDRFGSLADARLFCEGFFLAYNHEHRHSGIGMHTPASVHFGTAGRIRDQRQATLDRAHARHPERFARRPRPPALPEVAWINQPLDQPQPAP